MSIVRSESQSHYGRRRSNTAQSLLRPIPVVPLEYGDSTTLNSWVHDPKESSNVILNHAYWPGVKEGDMLSVSATDRAFIFMVPKDDGCSKPQLQISVPKPIADTFEIRNNSEVTVTKVEKEKYHADYVEVSFQDQYLGRNEMWRLGKHLVNQCVYHGQEVSFIGSITAKIQDILVGGSKVPAALITSSTKIIYRSLSAKVTIFIQVCHELWEFAGDGERYNEKVVHSFLPALFSKWKEAGTNHTVTIVLISRVHYDQSEIKYAAGPLRRDERGTWYKDFYKVITDLEVIHEWKPTLVSLKNSFWDFQRDILLAHHYHRASLDSAQGATEHVRLVGRISFAHDGPILEALNLNLYPSETHYIDRSLVLTGASTILITPGTGYFRVSKQLLRLTTTRMLDQGFGLDLISLARSPLHQSPIFSFQSSLPDGKLDKDGPYGSRVMDPLWGCDEDPALPASNKKATFWWEPFWVQMSFWDEQMDVPFRQDRFTPRAKMYEIEMLGLLDHDVLPSIEVPFLPPPDGNQGDPYGSPSGSTTVSKEEADQFDNSTFSFQSDKKPAQPTLPASRNSLISNASLASSLRTLNPEKRASHRNSVIPPNIERIEESPRHIIKDLPPDDDSALPSISVKGLSSSPSQASVLSNRSAKSNKSAASQLTAASTRKSHSPSRNTLASKLTPSWLFKPFRSGPVEPQTSAISASASSSTASSSPSMREVSPKSKPIVPSKGSPRSTAPLTIKNSTIAPSVLSRAGDDDPFHASNTGSNTGSLSRAALIRRSSPINTPPRGSDIETGRRRSTNLSIGFSYPSSSESPSYLRANPSRPISDTAQPTHTQDNSGGLASRWQHIYSVPTPWHEVKWKAIVTPACLPLTVEYFPKAKELGREYDVYTYDFVVDPAEMRKSFMVNPPEEVKGRTPDAQRSAWALVVMRGMAAVRLAQGFQFVIQPPKMEEDSGGTESKDKVPFRRTQSFLAAEDDMTLTPKFRGAAEVLQSTTEPVYLSMSNEIHRISYTGEAIQVRRYVRRMPPTQPFEYQCLIWPKLGVGYTEQKITFNSHGLENYGWNRLDMLVAGYEHQFNESLRYWRTRFVVIPTTEPPGIQVGPNGEKLDEEEARILGIEKLAEQFTKLRWQPPEERSTPAPAVRFLPTTLNPVESITDDHLMEQLDQIHAAGPLKKKMKSERDITTMTLMAIAKAMREEDGLPIKMHQWHRSQYADTFTGYDFVSWLVREFRDVSSRAQGTELGVKLMEEGLFEHVRGHHGFLDGHYFYRLKGEYAIASTPRRWFRARPSEDFVTRSGFYPGNAMRVMSASPRKNKRRLILSQTMVIDIDPNNRSDQAESVLLHHDIIHNPYTVFHFELQWIGTTARFIEDQLRTWSRAIEKYGLKLVEAYVGQISDIRDRNPFQSCFPVRLALPPPIVPDLQQRVAEGTQTARYFEYALLRHFGFIVDVEAADLYPENIDVVYSYRRSPFKYSQFVHRSGVAFVQVLGGTRGFLFLTNRLMGPGRMGKTKGYRPAVEAEKIRVELHQFCSDKQKLDQFYDEELARLGQAPEEPPPLSI